MDRRELIERLEKLSLEDQRTLAEKHFPEQWRRTLTMPGKNRRTNQANLRKAAIEAVKCDAITADGGCCRNCKHLLRNPAGLHGLFCDLQSDFEGYTHTKERNVCSWWTPAALRSLDAEG